MLSTAPEQGWAPRQPPTLSRLTLSLLFTGGFCTTGPSHSLSALHAHSTAPSGTRGEQAKETEGTLPHTHNSTHTHTQQAVSFGSPQAYSDPRSAFAHVCI